MYFALMTGTAKAMFTCDSTLWHRQLIASVQCTEDGMHGGVYPLYIWYDYFASYALLLTFCSFCFEVTLRVGKINLKKKKNSSKRPDPQPVFLRQFGAFVVAGS